jgi:hypothetical protein
MAVQFNDRDTDPRDSIGQPESMRNEEQKLRDNQGGSELTDRPDDHPVGAPGETASAEAEGPPPATTADASDEEIGPGDNADIAVPVRSLGPVETTLPEESPLEEDPESGDTARARAVEKLRKTRVEPGGVIVPPEEGDE